MKTREGNLNILQLLDRRRLGQSLDSTLSPKPKPKPKPKTERKKNNGTDKS